MLVAWAQGRQAFRVDEQFDAARDAGPTPGPRYSVVETQAHNLIITDNQTNILYFYTIDKDKPIGSEFKLRGSIDLTKVGEPVIKPKKVAAE